MAEKNETLKEKLYQELYNAGLDDIADVVDKLKDDEDVRKYMWGNRAYFDKMFNSEDFAAAPTFNDLVHNDYTGGKLDLDKQFGKDWDKDFNDISLNKVKFEAMKAGRDWKDLYNEMRDVAINRERYRVAHGEEEGGWFDSPKAFGKNLAGAYMSMFAPRQQEAIARGEEPTVKDNLLDAAQTTLEAMPWGRGVGIGGKATRYILSNVTAPLATETLDAAAYDAEENPRGEFNTTDVIGGTATNVATPFGIKLFSKGAGKVGPQGTKEFLKKVEDFGDLEKKSVEDIERKMKHGHTSQSTLQGLNTRLKKGDKLSAAKQLEAASFDPEYKSKFDVVRKKIKAGEQLTEQELNFVSADDELREMFLRGQNKTRSQLMGEESIKNLATNKYGNYKAEQGEGMTRLPVFGRPIQKYLNEQDEEAKQMKVEQEILNELRTRGLLMGDK